MEDSTTRPAAHILTSQMKLQELAERIGAEVAGDAAVDISGIASVQSARAGDLVFVEDEKWIGSALECAASAVVTGDFARHPSAKPLIIAKQPKLAFARAAAILNPSPSRASEIHASAVVDPSATLAEDVSVGSNAVVEAGAKIGARSRIGPGTVIGTGVELGRDCDIKANVTIYAGTRIGDRVIVHSGAVLGSDGFGFVRDRATGRYEKFPQIGGLDIGDDVEIGANTTIDRGALDATVIGRGTKLDNMVHIGHNVGVGEDVVIAAQTGISGSVSIADGATIGGQVGIGDHVRIEEGVILGSQSGVLPHKIVRGKGVVFWGTPAKPLKEYLKELAALARLAKK